MTSATEQKKRIGCAAIPAGVLRDRYLGSLDFLELGGTFHQVPKTAAMRKRAREAPDGFAHGMVAWQVISHRPGPGGYRRLSDDLGPGQLAECGWFRDNPTIRGAVDRVAAACAALEAETVVFRSPPDFAPSSANRDTLSHFFDQIATAEQFGTTSRVWEAQGLWEQATVNRLARDLGLVVAADPLAKDPTADATFDAAALPGERGYFRLSGLGHQGKLPLHDLEELAELSLGCSQAWFVFASSDAFRDAVGLRKLLAA